MPLYVFICNNDDCEIESFEELAGYNDDTTFMCPGCGEVTKSRKEFYQFDFRM
jgi:predicted RNA-binding Zn-ribbon protein involved in translation (DUF1610 family)|tara:strand:+ start:219 stop:377 length:159 start_codon:yes stop_codon:yes gene_type:complete